MPNHYVWLTPVLLPSWQAGNFSVIISYLGKNVKIFLSIYADLALKLFRSAINPWNEWRYVTKLPRFRSSEESFRCLKKPLDKTVGV
jgi:hypothetical protein